MKKIYKIMLSLLIIFGILSQQTSFGFTSLSKIRDVNDAISSDSGGYKYFDAVKWGYEVGIFDGFKDGVNQGKFLPNSNVTRVEFIKMLFKTLGEDVNNSNNTKCVKDSVIGAWWNPYVCISKNKGYIKGYPDGTFKPNNNITVSEAYAILTRAFGVDSSMDISPDFIDSWNHKLFVGLDDYNINKSNWIYSSFQKSHNVGIRFDEYYTSNHCQSFIFYTYTGDVSLCKINDIISKPLSRGQMINLLYQEYGLYKAKISTQAYYNAIKNKDGKTMYSLLSTYAKKLEGDESRLDSLVKEIPVTIDSISYKGGYFLNGITDIDKYNDQDGHIYSHNAVKNIYTIRLHVNGSSNSISKDVITYSVFEDNEWKVLNDYNHFYKIKVNDIRNDSRKDLCYSKDLKMYGFLGLYLDINNITYKENSCSRPSYYDSKGQGEITGNLYYYIWQSNLISENNYNIPKIGKTYYYNQFIGEIQ